MTNNQNQTQVDTPEKDKVKIATPVQPAVGAETPKAEPASVPQTKV